MFNIIWKFEVNKDHKRSFEELYGQEGKGVRLFKTGMGYIKTELLQDELQPGQYVTIDTWESQDLYERFLKENVVQFKALDQEGESLTISEKKRVGGLKVLIIRNDGSRIHQVSPNDLDDVTPTGIESEMVRFLFWVSDV